MPLQDYGVLTAGVIDRRREGSTYTPHFQIHLRDDAGTEFRAAVNVLSSEAPSELLYLVDEDPRHPVTDAIQALGSGWHALAPRPGGANLDYVRANLFDPSRMRPLPPNISGPDNDLADLLDHYIQRASADTTARLSVFGQRWGPEQTTKDKIFGFLPGNGVHDVHMNQATASSSAATTGCGRTAACSYTCRESHVRSASSSPFRARNGTPTTAQATRSPTRPRHQTGSPRPCASSPPWSTPSGPPRNASRWC